MYIAMSCYAPAHIHAVLFAMLCNTRKSQYNNLQTDRPLATSSRTLTRTSGKKKGKRRRLLERGPSAQPPSAVNIPERAGGKN